MIDIRKASAPIKNRDEAIGSRVKVKIIKNKVAPPFKQAEFEIMYGEGISKTREILDQAVELGIVKKSSSWFSYEDTKLGQGRDTVKEVLRDNPELADQIKEIIVNK
ncbi:recombinase RecA [Riemerella anatipestifer]|nr:recombinase RecA [Riemerella anatipestifer]